MLTQAKNGVGTFGQQPIRAIMGGAMCPPTLRRELAEHYPNMELFVVFGCTENSPCSFGTNLDCPKVVRETTCGYVMECFQFTEDGPGFTGRSWTGNENRESHSQKRKLSTLRLVELFLVEHTGRSVLAVIVSSKDIGMILKKLPKLLMRMVGITVEMLDI